MVVKFVPALTFEPLLFIHLVPSSRFVVPCSSRLGPTTKRRMGMEEHNKVLYVLEKGCWKWLKVVIWYTKKELDQRRLHLNLKRGRFIYVSPHQKHVFIHTLTRAPASSIDIKLLKKLATGLLVSYNRLTIMIFNKARISMDKLASNGYGWL